MKTIFKLIFSLQNVSWMPVIIIDIENERYY